MASMKSEKQRFVKLFNNVEHENSQHEQNISILVEDYNRSADQNDELLKSGIKTQKDNIKSRIEQRRNVLGFSFFLPP